MAAILSLGGQVPDPKKVEEDLAAADIPGQKCTLLLILDMPKKHLTKNNK